MKKDKLLPEIKSQIHKELYLKDTPTSWSKPNMLEVISFCYPSFDTSKNYGSDWWWVIVDAFGKEPDWDHKQERTHNQPNKHNCKVILRKVLETKEIEKEKLFRNALVFDRRNKNLTVA
jgi:hypothetical protein